MDTTEDSLCVNCRLLKKTNLRLKIENVNLKYHLLYQENIVLKKKLKDKSEQPEPSKLWRKSVESRGLELFQEKLIHYDFTVLNIISERKYNPTVV